jgi:hypothetical protein
MYEENSDFEEIISGLGSLVGEQEIEARRVLGDERYEKTVAFFETANTLTLKRDVSQIRHLDSISSFYGAVSIFVLFSCVMGLVWSLYFWFN